MASGNRHPSRLLRISMAGLLLIPVPGGDPGPKTADGIYGSAINYIEHLSIDYPRFSLRFIEKKPLDHGSPETAVVYSFQIVDGTRQQRVDWRATGYRQRSFEAFTVDGQTYFIDLKRSDFTGNRLGDGELIVWTAQQYEQFEERRRAAWRRNMEWLSRSSIKHARQEAARERPAFFKPHGGQLQALHMAAEEAGISRHLP